MPYHQWLRSLYGLNCTCDRCSGSKLNACISASVACFPLSMQTTVCTVNSEFCSRLCSIVQVIEQHGDLGNRPLPAKPPSLDLIVRMWGAMSKSAFPSLPGPRVQLEGIGQPGVGGSKYNLLVPAQQRKRKKINEFWQGFQASAVTAPIF